MKALLKLLKPLFFVLSRILLLPFRLFRRGLAKLSRSLVAKRMQKHVWFVVDLEGHIRQLEKKTRFAHMVRSWLGLEERSRIVLSDLHNIVERLLVLRPKGVVLRIGPVSGGFAKASLVRNEISRLREAKIPVVAHLKHSASNKELLIATAADEIYALPSAHLGAIGTSSVALFFPDVLDKIGVEFEVHSKGKYKSAVEPFTRRSRSEPDREQTGRILQTFDARLENAIAQSRSLDGDAARALIDAAPFTGAEARAQGLIDDAITEESLVERLEARTDKPCLLVGAQKLAHAPRSQEPLFAFSRPQLVGLVEVKGVILDEESQMSQLQEQAVSRAVIHDVRRAEMDPEIGAVVLVIDSRGGSVTASEAIHSAVEKLAAKKPVVALLQDVAASGGYFVACGAKTIVAQPLTITGSIGVFSAMPRFESSAGLLGLHVDALKHREHATFYSPFVKRSEAEGQLLDRHVADLYDQFLQVVANARGRSTEEIEAVAQGRVWTGEDAKEHGLVDELGNLSLAISLATKDVAGRFDPTPVLVRAKKPLLPKPSNANEKAVALAILERLKGGEAPAEIAREMLALATTGTSAWAWAPITSA